MHLRRYPRDYPLLPLIIRLARSKRASCTHVLLPPFDRVKINPFVAIG